MVKTYTKVIAFVLVLAGLVLYLMAAGYAMYLAAESKIWFCKDFRLKADAQKALDTGEERYSRLDGDNDGEACDYFPFSVKEKLNKIEVK